MMLARRVLVGSRGMTLLLPRRSVEFHLEPGLPLSWYLGVFPDGFPGSDETSVSLGAEGTQCTLCIASCYC